MVRPFESPSRIRRWPVLLLGLLPLGCPGDEVPNDDEAGPTVLPGDLVITEVMADPEGADDGLEWFEIHNASGTAIDLEGFELVYSRTDGTGRKTHAIGRSLIIEPGEYLVVGGVLDEIATESDADHLDYGYGGDLGDFVGSGGYLAVVIGEDPIDEMLYAEATSGASRAFDGTFSPDAAANDDPSRWCDSRTEFEGPDFRATPGTANDLCTQGDCLENGELRPVVPAGPGAFVITEVHANPQAVADDLGEWFEIHALTDFDLNGLTIGRDLEAPEVEQQLLDSECLPVAAGDYVVFAHDLDAMLNGGIPAEAMVQLLDAGVALTVDGSLWMATAGEGDMLGTRIDEVTWSADEGESTQLDPDFEDATANDDLGNWCPATLPYGDGDLGSPGAANEECAIAPPEGQCLDAATDELRDINPVPLGDLVITELLANPVGDDAPGEWFEVLAKSGGDLNGLWIGKLDAAFTDSIVSEACIEVGAGDYLIFAHEDDPLVNGNLPQVDAIFDLALNNSSSGLKIGYGETADTVVLQDQVTWTSTMEGISNSYGGDLNTVANDDEMAWCPGEPSTPGEANPSCGGAPMDECIDPDTNMLRPLIAPLPGDLQLTEVMPNPDAVPDADGEWFEIHTTAAFDLNGLQFGKNGVVEHTLSDPNCLEVQADSWVAFAVDADPLVNCGVDPVAAVYEGLSLTNSAGNLFVGHADVVLDEFSWATSPTGATLSRDLMADMWCPAVMPYGCGDLGTPAAANPACGGMMGDMCLDGGMPRAIVVPQIGDLVITEFMANPNAVPDADGEWFELRALADVDLNGLEFGNAQFVMGVAPDLTLGSPDCLSVVAGQNLLFARDGDPLVNGNLPPVDFEFNFGLTNSNAFLYIGHSDALLDEIGWTSSADGQSTSLDPDFQDPALNDMAVNGMTWCYQPGTPGSDNGQCG
jgi:hypothetical protein